MLLYSLWCNCVETVKKNPLTCRKWYTYGVMLNLLEKTHPLRHSGSWNLNNTDWTLSSQSRSCTADLFWIALHTDLYMSLLLDTNTAGLNTNDLYKKTTQCRLYLFWYYTEHRDKKMTCLKCFNHMQISHFISWFHEFSVKWHTFPLSYLSVKKSEKDVKLNLRLFGGTHCLSREFLSILNSQFSSRSKNSCVCSYWHQH